MEKILSLTLKLNFSPNTLGCYGLMLFKQPHALGLSVFEFASQDVEFANSFRNCPT